MSAKLRRSWGGSRTTWNLCEVLDPKLQGLADQLEGQLVERVAALRRG
jgi:hypothetical protein